MKMKKGTNIPKRDSRTFSLQDIQDFNEEEDIEGQDDSSTNESTGIEEHKERIVIGHRENKQVSCLRFVVILVLVGVATAVSVLVYFYSTNVENEDFEKSFLDSAEKVVLDCTGGAEKRISAVTALGQQLTSYAIATYSIWPNVMFPDFERQAKFTLQSSDLMSLIVFPIVTNETRMSWEYFSVKNQGWLKDALAWQGIPKEEWDKESITTLQNTWGSTYDLKIPADIFRVSGIGQEPENGPGPYAPWWQFAPAFPVPTLCNYNGMSHPTRQKPLTSVLVNKKVLLTEAWDYSDVKNPGTVGKKAALNLFRQHGGDLGNYQDGPVSDLYVPIFEDYSNDKKVVAELAGYVYWQVYFENILPERNIGIRVILENTCDQQFTYQLDGSTARYIGPGELYDKAYEHLEVSTEYGSFVGFHGDVKDLPHGQCLYRVRVYPSKTFEDQFKTSGPLRFTLILVATFSFTCFVFLLYDYLVERRQTLVLRTAVQSTAVVASLFPEEVRDRLYEKNSNDKKKETATKNDETNMDGREEDKTEKNISIADLYPNCTVMFADIVGFTKWSAKRQPTEVFCLLETMYKSFDMIATRSKVFKVETIGDCYVAVTGLPTPQEDHAVIMARFAQQCLLKVPKVTHRVADKLSEAGDENNTNDDTFDLTLRVGLHSGPVTAGVLRGLKARFQLFGDTVNTAARMESTGQPGKIQVSSSTANLLIAAGKIDWIRPREDAVEAKGKGSMETFWLDRTTTNSSHYSSHYSGNTSFSTDDD